MSSLPSALVYKARRLQSTVGVTHVKVPSITSGAYSDGQQIMFQLPSNSTIDCKSLRVYFKLSATGSPTFTANVSRAEPLIHRLDVQVSGTNVTSIPSYGRIVQGLDQVLDDTDHTQAGFNSTYLTGTLTNKTVCVRGFKFGFLSGEPVRYIDSGLFKNCMVTVTLPPNLIAALGLTGGTTPAVTVQEAYMTCQTVSFHDDMYREALRADLASGSISLAFKNAIVRQSPTFSNSTDFSYSINTGSLDRIVTMLPAFNYTTSATNFHKSTPTTTGVGYITLADKRLHSHNISMEDGEWLETFIQNIGAPGRGTVVDEAKWASDYGMLTAKLSLPGAELSGLVSGYDTSLADGNVTVSLEGVGTNLICLVLNECTSKVQVSSDGSIVMMA